MSLTSKQLAICEHLALAVSAMRRGWHEAAENQLMAATTSAWSMRPTEKKLRALQLINALSTLLEKDAMNGPNRRTGRTTRLITEALERAKEGHNVVFYVGTFAMVRYAQDMAIELLGSDIDKRGRSDALLGTFRVAGKEANRTSLERGVDRLAVRFDHPLP